MQRDEFILKVENIDDLHEHAREAYHVEFGGNVVVVTAWNEGMVYMIDQEITFHFPELRDLGLEELQEGDMVYEGELGKVELAHTLMRMGFNVFVNNEQVGGAPNLQPEENRERATDDPATLQSQMQRAIEKEDFEEAARIRDILKDM